MPSIYLYLRYLTYGLFVVCNAIVASVAVWGLSLAQTVRVSVSTEPYLIFVGSFGLVAIFSIIFTELLRRNAFTSTVWFECLWTGLFLFLELVGASLVAGVPSNFCAAPIKNAQVAQKNCKTSTQVLQGFTWLITVILLFYFFALIICSCLDHYKNGSAVWFSNIRNFPSFGYRHRQTVPSTPMLERFFSRPTSIVAPKPRRPSPDIAHRFHSGLSQYEIEHYRPPSSVQAQPADSNDTQSPRTAAYYPQYLQSSLISHPPATYHPQNTSVISQISPASPPPPLGNWPRQDVMIQPLNPKQRATSSSDEPISSGALRPSISINSRQKPTGPRGRSFSGDNYQRPMVSAGSKPSSANERNWPGIS